jgi:hypothetical protein
VLTGRGGGGRFELVVLVVLGRGGVVLGLGGRWTLAERRLEDGEEMVVVEVEKEAVVYEGLGGGGARSGRAGGGE